MHTCCFIHVTAVPRVCASLDQHHMPALLPFLSTSRYRARQYWTWNEAEGKCYVKVRPFQAGATVLTMRKASGVISGMFGNEP